MELSKSALTVEYCEFNNPEALFHQKINTYSNLIYFFLGMVIMLFSKSNFNADDSQNRLVSFSYLSILLGVCFIYLSFGSAFFHASLTWAGQRVDMNGTYSLSIVTLAIGLYSVFHKVKLSEKSKKMVIAGLVLIIVAFYEIHLRVSSSLLLPAFILCIWLLTIINYFQFRKQRSLLLAIASFVLIIAALKVRQLDVDKIGCDPNSIFQGHSLWHVMTGVSSFCGYAFFRFEKRLK
ncbi:MAG: ceramidase [Spirosomaceae bacterium]|nr:ceramidase [Spirosomataceae bacterium]